MRRTWTTSVLVAYLASQALAAPLGDTASLLGNGFISNLPASSIAHQSGGDEYVVLFNQSHPELPGITDVLSRVGLAPEHSDVLRTYNNSYFRGFSAKMKSHCIDALNGMVDVASVSASVGISAKVTQLGGAPWGLQRVSTQSTVMGDADTLGFTYSFADASLGAGVDIYVVDTGVNVDHVAFGGRATMGWTFDAALATDGDGHGTHVSGTAAASTFGIAPGANIIGVKVLDDSGAGSSASTIAGIDWVIQQHDAKRSSSSFRGSVMSMSWGLSSIDSNVDQVIRAATSAGVHAVVAAGNSASDSCDFSPASSGGSQGPAISVGSIGESNAISSFSNTGACTDIYAPGEKVISTWIGGNNIINIDQGTSMAAPHVTGVVAYFLDSMPQYMLDPAGMKQFILNGAIRDQVTGAALTGDAKLLLNNGVGGAPDGQIRRDLPRRTEKASNSLEQSEWSLSFAGPATSL